MADIIFAGETPVGTLGLEFLPANYNLKLWRGDYFSFTLQLTNPDDSPMTLTGYTGQASIKSISPAPPISFSFETVVNEAAGEVTYTLPSSISVTIPVGDYIWDVQTTNPSGNVRTHIAGDVQVFEHVTE